MWQEYERYPTRRYQAESSFFVPIDAAKGVLRIERRYPLGDQAPRTEEPEGPKTPAPELVKEVADTLQTWEQCISADALQRLKKAEARILRDEREASTGALQHHRQRTRLGHAGSEVRIGPDEYHPTVCKVLQSGHTLEIPPGEPPRIRQVSPLSPERWGFDAKTLLKMVRQ